MSQGPTYIGAVTGTNSSPNELVVRINQILTRLTRSRGGVTEFLIRTEPAFINELKNKINYISTTLANLNIEGVAGNIEAKTAQLRQVANQFRQQVQQLTDANGQLTQERDRLNNVNQQLNNDNQQLVTSSQQLRDDNQLKTQIITDATNALNSFEQILTQLEGEANNIQQKNQEYTTINQSLNALSQLVDAKLNAYQRLQALDQQQGGKNKKLWGGYSYPSEGYDAGEEVIFVPTSRSARRSSRNKRQRNHHNKTHARKSRAKART